MPFEIRINGLDNFLKRAEKLGTETVVRYDDSDDDTVVVLCYGSKDAMKQLAY